MASATAMKRLIVKGFVEQVSIERAVTYGLLTLVVVKPLQPAEMTG